MGYTTEFDGEFAISPNLTDNHARYLKVFAETRRMKRNPDLLPSDPIREVVGLPAGIDGGYFVGGLGSFGQDEDGSVIDGNKPPTGQPGLWCQWVSNDEGTALEWDGSEKFYDYVEWLKYLIEHFFKPWGYTLNGCVLWQGEEIRDRGNINVKDNEVKVIKLP